VSEGENHRLTMNKMAPLAQIPQNSNPAVEIEAIDGNGDRPGDEPVGSANPYEAMLSKMVAKLPYNVRETVGSIVQLTAQTSENARKRLNSQNIELIELKGKLKKKGGQLEHINKTCDIYRERLKGLEEKLRSLQDTIVSRQRITTQNKRIMSRISNANKMLIGTLEALQIENVEGMAEMLKEMENNGSGSPQNEQNGANTGAMTSTGGSGVIMKGDSGNAMNDKLRDSLLRIAREHYRLVKRNETLENQVFDLHGKLRESDGAARRFKLELSELTHNSAEGTELVSHQIKGESSTVDDKIKFEIIKRHAADPLDALIQLRRITSNMIIPLGTTSHPEIYLRKRVLSREMCNSFGVDGLVLFIQEKGRSFRKYSSEGNDEVVSVNASSSLAGTTFNQNESFRSNDISGVHSYDEHVDRCGQLRTKRILSVPVRDKSSDMILGVLHFINRKDGGFFTGLDEVFGTIFADQTGTQFSTLYAYGNATRRSDYISSLLHSSDLLANNTSNTEDDWENNALVVQDLLIALELAVKRVLKCMSARAFLVSSHLSGSCDVEDLLTTLDPAELQSSAASSKTRTTELSGSSCIAGYVVRKSQLYVMDDATVDEYYNPTWDLPSKEDLPVVAMPIVDLEGTCLGCIEVVPSELSPPMTVTEFGDPNLAFPKLAQWLSRQLAPYLRHALGVIGSVPSQADVSAGKIKDVSMLLEQAMAEKKTTVEALAERDQMVLELQLLIAKNGEELTGAANRVSVLESRIHDKDVELKASLSDHTELRSRYENELKERDAQILEAQSTLSKVEPSAGETSNDRIKEVEDERDRALASAQSKNELLSVLERSIGEKQSQIDTLMQQMNNLEEQKRKESGTALSKSEELTKLTESFDAKMSKKEKEFETAAYEMRAEIKGLKEDIEKKDSVLAILQDQLVNMATNDLQALNKPTESHQNAPNEFDPTGVWSKYLDDGGNVYYHNNETNETTWDNPFDSSPNGPKSSSNGGAGLRKGDWTQFFDDNGREYWTNELTNESVWELPEESNISKPTTPAASEYTIEL